MARGSSRSVFGFHPKLLYGLAIYMDLHTPIQQDVDSHSGTNPGFASLVLRLSADTYISEVENTCRSLKKIYVDVSAGTFQTQFKLRTSGMSHSDFIGIRHHYRSSALQVRLVRARVEA